MSEEFIDKLIEKGTVLMCAGSFCVEEMEEHVNKIEGSRDCVIGFCTKEELLNMMIEVDD